MTRPSPAVVAEVKRLYRCWTTAIERAQQDSSDLAIWAEQDTYDAIVSYVDSNDLTYGIYDPRGPA